MRKWIKAPSPKTDTSLSVKKKPFTIQLHNYSIKFNPRPFQSGQKFKFRKRLKKYKISHSHEKIVKEIDDSLGKNVNDTDIKDDLDADYEEKTIISSAESSEVGKVLEKNLVGEQTGFGWKGLGARNILFDDIKKEYRYDITEPSLDVSEEAIKDKIIYLFRIRADLDVFDIDEKEKKQYLESALQKIINEHNIKIESESKDRIFYHIFRDFLGYGKIDILMHDAEIEDISCDGHGIPIFVYHRKHESIPSNIVFTEADELDSFVVRLSQMCGKQISVYKPVVDGKLSDGSRLQTTLARTITYKSTFTIRKFREDPLTPVDLIANNTMSVEMAAYFWMAIEKSSSILFCGGTATGKTTMLNALSLFLPASYKIVSIEDTREINLPHENWIAGTTRTGFSASEATKTAKDIDMFDLVRVALRQRPQVIIVGEVRGKEAYTLFQAMTTGHLSYSTIHASNLHALIQRLENPPISLPRALLTSLDLVVFLNSVTVDGTPVRRVTNVTEIIKLDPDSNRLVTMTPYHWISEVNDQFEANGGSSVLSRIKKQNGWNNDRLHQEINNRMILLNWMIRRNLRSYEEVGRIVSEYRKDPESVLRKVREDKL
jgi:flagellar protein FlaI